MLLVVMPGNVGCLLYALALMSKLKFAYRQAIFLSCSGVNLTKPTGSQALSYIISCQSSRFALS